MRRFPASFFLAVFLSGCLPTEAFAHAVGLDCTRRLRQIEVEVFYDDDTSAQNAKVQVVNAKEEIVAGGVTDSEGRWSFRKPAPGKYEVRVDAGAGHRANKKIEVPASTAAEATLGILLDLSLVVEDAEPASPTDAKSIGAGPTRSDFTRTPWLKVAIGLLIIGGLSGAFLLASMLRKAGKLKI